MLDITILCLPFILMLVLVYFSYVFCMLMLTYYVSMRIIVFFFSGDACCILICRLLFIITVLIRPSSCYARDRLYIDACWCLFIFLMFAHAFFPFYVYSCLFNLCQCLLYFLVPVLAD